MGGAVVSGGGGRSKRGRRSHTTLSEINVTPFVDVMLVLLIIFMVAAPLMTVGVTIELPETRAKELQGDNEPLTVSVTVDGKIFLQNTEIEFDTLTPKLLAIAKNGIDEQIFVRADQAVDWGHVAKVMGELNRAGFRKLGLVTDMEQNQK